MSYNITTGERTMITLSIYTILNDYRNSGVKYFHQTKIYYLQGIHLLEDIDIYIAKNYNIIIVIKP